MRELNNIPELNLQDFFSKNKSVKNKFVQDLGNALKDIGFFALNGHGIDQSVLDNTYKVANKFFDLSEENKLKYEIKGLGGQRGFTSFGREHAKNHKAADLKEFWHLGQKEEPILSEPSFIPNIWPTEIPEFQAATEESFNKLMNCALSILDACSLYIGEKENFLRSMVIDGNSILRIINYPPIPLEVDPVSIRAAAHEDINLITLLCEATAPGLELLKKDGSWLPIQALKGQIIVDSGDMLQNITNGLIRSTTHRVSNPENSRERRFSMPLFVHPRSSISLAPLDKCVQKTGGHKIYPDITAGEYLSNRLKEIGLKRK